MRPSAVAVGAIAGLLLFELVCQLWWFRVESRFDATRSRADFYYAADPKLAYSLKPGFRFERDGKRIAIDKRGLRSDGDSPASIGILGDSVVFGVGHSQDQTPVALAGPEYLNLAVPGYGLAEISALYRLRRPELEGFVYVLNPNDFARRNTRFEGADNGLYRMFVAPGLKTPYFLGKALYRYRKTGSVFSSSGQTADWYRWLYEGTHKESLAELETMLDGPDRFAILVLPTGSGPLPDITVSVCSVAKQHGAPCRPAFHGRDPLPLFDATDHLTAAGNRALAQEIVDITRDWL